MSTSNSRMDHPRGDQVATGDESRATGTNIKVVTVRTLCHWMWLTVVGSSLARSRPVGCNG